MTSPHRAAFALRFNFTESQQADLRRLLKRKRPEHVDAYLKMVESKIPFLRGDWEIMGATPLEPRAKAKEMLDRIARNALALHEDLECLDEMGSRKSLVEMLSRLGRGEETFSYLSHDLPLIHVCAKQAARTIEAPRRGRPIDLVERGYIGAFGLAYKECFGKVPSHSRGTEFPIFVARVLEIALSGNPHGVEDPSAHLVDNSKIVTIALRDAGLIR